MTWFFATIMISFGARFTALIIKHRLQISVCSAVKSPSYTKETAV